MPLFASLSRLFSFLVSYTRHVPHARLLGAGVVVLAVLSGVANTALVALVNRVINAPGPDASLLALFLGICVAFPVLRYLGVWLLIHLTEAATMHLRTTLCARVLAVPLRRLEELGPVRVNNVLVNDLPTVASTTSLIPQLSLNLTVVLGCLGFMGVLSWRMLLGVLVFLVAGVFAYQVPLVRGHGHFQALRERGDDLFRHFRSLTDGVKELKLHRERRHAFLDGQVGGTAAQVREHAVAAQRAFSAAVSWGQVLIFLLIAVVAFGLPAVAAVEGPVLPGFAFALPLALALALALAALAVSNLRPHFHRSLELVAH